jgi:uncharacterized protein DUF2513
MQRDLELIRKMLLAIEESESGWAPEYRGPSAFEGYDAGLARGSEVTQFGAEAPEGHITSLTWAGHEFIEAARDEGRWKTAMTTVAQKGGAITLDVLKQVLIGYMRTTFGLP